MSMIIMPGITKHNETLDMPITFGSYDPCSWFGSKECLRNDK